MCVVAEGSHGEFQFYCWLSWFSQHLSGFLTCVIRLVGWLKHDIVISFSLLLTVSVSVGCSIGISEQFQAVLQLKCQSGV